MAKMNKGGYITSPLLTVVADRPIHVGLKSEPREVFEVKVVVSRNTPCLFTYEIDEEGKLECPSELLDYQTAEAKEGDRDGNNIARLRWELLSDGHPCHSE